MNIKRLRRWTALVAGALVLLLMLTAVTLWWALHASLAQLDGQCLVPGLEAPVRIERDNLGVPTIHATNRLDATRALGFLHAQERFFQMDLSRRAGGGELSDLFGAVALARDRERRVHRPRSRAREALAKANAEEKALLRAYSEGVKEGLRALAVRPPEYLALRANPGAWAEEDTYLVAYAMFADLHDTEGYGDYQEEVLRRALSPGAVAFVTTPDSRWSAALDGSVVPPPRIPTPEEFRAAPAIKQASNSGRPADLATEGSSSAEDTPDPDRKATVGSNNWAVGGKRTKTRAAIVANDMHLGLMVPNTWYRVRLVYHDPGGSLQDITGVTLPGAPVVVSGSNRHIAWGNTASDLDVTDLVKLEFDPANPHRYRTVSGWSELEVHDEVISVRGNTNAHVVVEETLWGPVVTKGTNRYALACSVHAPEAVNLGLIQVEQSRDVPAALSAANASGTPVNNFVVGDEAGHIGYSLLGRLPKRVGFDGITPCSWTEPGRGWQGWIASAQYPKVIDPEGALLWTANNRTLGSPDYTILHAAPDLGARAHQIRDDLQAMQQVSERSLWEIYSDDRAVFMEPWQKLMLASLESGAPTNAHWREAEKLVKSWGGHAAIDSAGYRLVRGFRSQVIQLLFEPVNHQLAAFDPAMRVYNEEAAWALLEMKPPHFLDPRFASYDQLLAEGINRLIEDLVGRHIELSQATWGARNGAQIRHPLSMAVSALGRWLDMRDTPVSGDSNMPKVHAPGNGVSERMIVSPGHEQDGLYNMPCGQSGHFLSPFYRSEMEAWFKVEPEPFLPGQTTHQLELLPSRF